jgi:membrane dipeptidase
MHGGVRPNKGFHPELESDHPYIFIDACMQAWPDADFAIAHKHGVTAYGVTAFRPHADADGALEGLMTWHHIARRYPNLIRVETAGDINRAKRDGRAGLILASQDGEFIGDKLHRVEAFYRLGLRMLIPVYNRANLLGDGCLDRTDRGLTRLGQLVLKECNRLGMLVDCSHLSRRTALDVIESSQAPVIFSHSNPDALVPNPRNVTDEAIRKCAEKGGVVGVAPWGPLVLRPGSRDWPSVDDLVDLIDHIAQILGTTENIGIGTDMSIGTYPLPERDIWGEPEYPSASATYESVITGSKDLRSPLRGLRDFNSYPEVLNLVEALERRGYLEGDVRRILGENHLRLFAQVWK